MSSPERGEEATGRTGTVGDSPLDEIYDGEADFDAHWSRTNLAEAFPGVQTPLSWSTWDPAFEGALQRKFYTLGVLERARLVYPPPPEDRITTVFHGRVASKIEFVLEMGDRLPGTTGIAMAEQFFGELPPGLRSTASRRRLPIVAARLPGVVLRSPAKVRAVQAEGARRWRAALDRRTGALTQERAAWLDANAWLGRAYTAHTVVTSAVQLVYDAVLRLVAATGDPKAAEKIFAGQGSHAELVMVEDLWTLSRDGLTLDEFLGRHGYQGPAQGELSARVWREDPQPVIALRERYRSQADDENPQLQHARAAKEAKEAKAELIAKVPARRRPYARTVLAMADRYMGLRGVGKAAYVQAFDVCRLTARRIGAVLHESGALPDPEDVFYLTRDELVTVAPGASLAGLVASRSARRRKLETLDVPSVWKGRPRVTSGPQDFARVAGARIDGIGTSPGIVAGPVRVITDPAQAEVEPGEILVAPVTDPSWASIMFVSAGLVVDIGGLLSHASVVARELGIPCVMGAGDASRRLRTGDVCRVDGSAGTVEILRLADDQADGVG